MKQNLKEELKIPEGISIKIENSIFHVKKAETELQRKLHNPKVNSRVIGEVIVFESKNATQREKKLINAYVAHLKNMFKGLDQPHIYKLKICSGHFPMSVAVKGSVFEIKNFVGETVPRTIQIPDGVTVKVEGQFITVEGADKEITSQTAASIEKLTRRSGFDKRIFQDGVFIIEKDGKPIK